MDWERRRLVFFSFSFFFGCFLVFGFSSMEQRWSLMYERGHGCKECFWWMNREYALLGLLWNEWCCLTIKSVVEWLRIAEWHCWMMEVSFMIELWLFSRTFLLIVCYGLFVVMSWSLCKWMSYCYVYIPIIYPFLINLPCSLVFIKIRSSVPELVSLIYLGFSNSKAIWSGCVWLEGNHCCEAKGNTCESLQIFDNTSPSSTLFLFTISLHSFFS